MGPSWVIAPYFIADDVVRTANYYRDMLGFEDDRFWNDPPSFCIVRPQRRRHHDQEFKAKGVKIVRDIGDRVYGNRDFDIEDCNGYRLCFGQDIP